jgi:hypothetical protein
MLGILSEYNNNKSLSRKVQNIGKDIKKQLTEEFQLAHEESGELAAKHDRSYKIAKDGQTGRKIWRCKRICKKTKC